MLISVNEGVYKRIGILDQTFAEMAYADPIPPQLFHYTPLAGALGILQSDELFLSDIFKTNDRDEIIHGLEIFNRCIHATKAFASVQRKLRFISYANESRRVDHIPRIFFFSLTENRNNIDRFDRYADKSRGVMLGFNTIPLNSGITSYDSRGYTSPRVLLLPVIYNDEFKTTILKAIVEAYCYVANGMMDNRQFNFDNRAYLFRSFFGNIYQTIGRFKASDWAPESEHRIYCPLLSKIIDPEVGKLGLRRPFQRVRGDIKVDYMRSFIDSEYENESRNLSMENGVAIASRVRLPICEIIRGANCNEPSLIDLVHQKHPSVPLTQSNAKLMTT